MHIGYWVNVVNGKELLLICLKRAGFTRVLQGFCMLHQSSISTKLITKYGSTLYIGMDEVFQHHAHTFEKSNLNFHFQCEFSSVAAEW